MSVGAMTRHLSLATALIAASGVGQTVAGQRLGPGARGRRAEINGTEPRAVASGTKMLLS